MWGSRFRLSGLLAEDHHAAVYHVDDAIDGDLAVAWRRE